MANQRAIPIIWGVIAMILGAGIAAISLSIPDLRVILNFAGGMAILLGLKAVWFGATASPRSLNSFVPSDPKSTSPDMQKYQKAERLARHGQQFLIRNELSDASNQFQAAVNEKNDFLPAYLGLAMVSQIKGNANEACRILENAPNEMRVDDRVIAAKSEIISKFKDLMANENID